MQRMALIRTIIPQIVGKWECEIREEIRKDKEMREKQERDEGQKVQDGKQEEIWYEIFLNHIFLNIVGENCIEVRMLCIISGLKLLFLKIIE
uniref:Uncharacterized protein n=1 Tax=Acrobeloides nanus TaxID=290746 RepID=A0A914BWV2_9BILA